MSHLTYETWGYSLSIVGTPAFVYSKLAKWSVVFSVAANEAKLIGWVPGIKLVIESLVCDQV